MTPASIRHRNPGAMYPGPSARKYGATSFSTLENGKHKIATFPSHEAGAAALFDLLGRGYCNMTLGRAITKWCGSNYASEYLAGIAHRTGFTPDTMVDGAFLSDPGRAVPLAVAMARHEAGQEYPLSEDDWREAHKQAMDGLSMAPRRAAPPQPGPAEGWTPDNAAPSPRPEARAEDASASRKTTIADAQTKVLVGTGGTIGAVKVAQEAGWFETAVKIVTDFASNNAALLVVGGIVAGLVVSETIKHLQRQDAAEGRYTPSGADQ